jgi:hypothetical protein
VRNLVLLIVGGAALFAIVAMAVTVVKTESLLHDAFVRGHNCCGPLDLALEHTPPGCDAQTLIRNLGGREKMLRRLRFHRALPRFLVSREARISALCLLGYCDREAAPLVETYCRDSDDTVKMTAEDARERLAQDPKTEAPR